MGGRATGVPSEDDECEAGMARWRACIGLKSVEAGLGLGSVPWRLCSSPVAVADVLDAPIAERAPHVYSFEARAVRRVGLVAVPVASVSWTALPPPLANASGTERAAASAEAEALYDGSMCTAPSTGLIAATAAAWVLLVLLVAVLHSRQRLLMAGLN